MSNFSECPTCKGMGDLLDNMLEGTKRVQDRYDELIRELILAIDELVDEDGNSHIDRLNKALYNIKEWLGWYDGRNETLLEWSERKS